MESRRRSSIESLSTRARASQPEGDNLRRTVHALLQVSIKLVVELCQILRQKQVQLGTYLEPVEPLDGRAVSDISTNRIESHILLA